jgi:hypothetical protein
MTDAPTPTEFFFLDVEQGRLKICLTDAELVVYENVEPPDDEWHALVQFMRAPSEAATDEGDRLAEIPRDVQRIGIVEDTIKEYVSELAVLAFRLRYERDEALAEVERLEAAHNGACEDNERLRAENTCSGCGGKLDECGRCLDEAPTHVRGSDD